MRFIFNLHKAHDNKILMLEKGMPGVLGPPGPPGEIIKDEKGEFVKVCSFVI